LELSRRDGASVHAGKLYASNSTWGVNEKGQIQFERALNAEERWHWEDDEHDVGDNGDEAKDE
jgi:hypothetical protein